MAWELISKTEVSKITGARETDLRDMWYDMAVGLIERLTGINHLGTTALIVETANGDGTGLLTVRKPPITSVTSIHVDGSLVSPDSYVVYETYIQLKDNIGFGNRISDVFPKASGNIQITYTSGTTGDHAIKLTIALLVKELVNFALGEGAETKIQFYRPGKSAATEEPLTQWGVHGKMVGIVHSILGYKMRVK